MVQTWNSRKGQDVTCAKCGAVYAVTITRFPAKDNDHFDCVVCGHRMREWNDTSSKSFELMARPKEKKARPKKKTGPRRTK
jgi:Zn ribbon nucleic-acid-binding protein